jgi:hypothetical protein
MAYQEMERTVVQKICAGVGMAFIMLVFIGIIFPGFMGMHLSIAHNLIFIISGAISIWVGYIADSRKAYALCVGLGGMYAFLGVVGYLFGQPGYPNVGQASFDKNLLTVIPDLLEFGSKSHAVHLFFSFILLFTAFAWNRHRNIADSPLIDVQRRKDKVGPGDFFRGTTTRPTELNSQTDLPDAELGRSDINRPSDVKRRDDFERRV